MYIKWNHKKYSINKKSGKEKRTDWIKGRKFNYIYEFTKYERSKHSN